MNHLQRLQTVFPPREARALYHLVLEVRFGLSPMDILLGKDKELSPSHRRELENIVERLLQHEPVQYILGQEDFCGHTLHVQPGVLIPRPETQDLVHLVMKRQPIPCRTLDIGTGSGCIAIALALRGHQVTAMDLSDLALDIATQNAQRLHAFVTFRQEDILHPADTMEQWDCIVSNPPYICHREANDMDPVVLEHEPHLALFVPDTDPLLFYRAIATYARQHLTPKGGLYLEINRQYHEQTARMLEQHGFHHVRTHQDRYGNNRFIEAQCLSKV